MATPARSRFRAKLPRFVSLRGRSRLRREANDSRRDGRTHEGTPSANEHAASDAGDVSTGAAIIATGTLVVLASTLLSPGIEAIQKSFEEQGGGFASPQLMAKMMVTAPAVVVGLIAPFGGWMLDKLGRRRVLLAGLAIFGLAGGVGGLLSSPVALLASRIVFGFGVAAILLSTTTLIGDYYDGRERQKMLGWQIAAIAIVATAGMFAAAWLVQQSWRWPFAIYTLALVLLPWAWKAIDEPDEAEDAAEESEGDPTGETAGSSAADDERGSIPWHTVGFIYVATFLALAIFHLATTQIPSYLEELGYGSPYMTATIISIISIVGVPSSLLFERARRQFSNQSLLISVFSVGAVGFFIAGCYESIWTLVVGLAVFGLLYGFRTPAFNAWLLNVAPERYRGRLVGGLTSASFLGIFASPLLSDPLRNAVGMPWVILIAAALQAVFAGAFAWFAIRQTGSDEAAESAAATDS